MNFILKTKALLFFLCITFSARLLAIQDIEPTTSKEDDRPWLTVFVHGNYGSFLTTLSFDSVLNGDYEKTPYLKVQQWLRNNKKFHTNRFLPEQGFRKINLHQPDTNNIVYAFANSYNDTLGLVDHQQASNTSYYSFGWNGLLCQKARRKEAIAFYASLSKELAEYKKQGVKPRVRIVCHSHGGNVALNLAGVYALLNQEQYQSNMTNKSIINIAQEISPELLPQLDPNLCIDELILLATPIQVETEEFVTSNLFKKIFNFYSLNDIIQIIDFISTEGPISKHTIDQKYLKPNIMQVHCSVTNHIQQQAPNFIIAFIKKCILAIKTTRKPGPMNKKQALATLLKSISAGNEAAGILPAVERTIQTITQLSNIPEEKDFDLQALNNELQAIQKNMLEHPNDPSHGDFVKTGINKKLKIVDPLPLFIWTPAICRILQEYPTTQAGSTTHATIHYYDKTIAINIEGIQNFEKKVEIPEKILLDLKKKFYTYLN